MPNYTLHYFNGRGRAECMRMMFHMAGVKYMDKRYEFSDWDRCRNDFPCNYLPCLEMDGGMRMPETMAICRYLSRKFGFYPKSSMDMMRCDYISDCFYEIMHDYMRYYHWKNGRFRYNWNDGGMMGSNMGSSGMMMGSNMGSSGMMGSNMGSSGMMMGSNMGCGDMMGSGGMMGSGEMMGSSGMMGGTGGMMGSGGMMGGSGGMMGSSGMMGGSGGMMGSGDSNCNYDNYMYWRYMNTFNRVMPFMERTLCMRNGGSQWFMGEKMMWCDMMFYCCMENMYNSYPNMFSSYPKMMGMYKRFGAYPKIASYLKSRCMTDW